MDIQRKGVGKKKAIRMAITLTVLAAAGVGITIGLAVSTSFILYSNLRRPMRRIVEKHLGGEVLHIQFSTQVSFLNRAALERILREVPRGGHVLLDASHTDYIDPDVSGARFPVVSRHVADVKVAPEQIG